MSTEILLEAIDLCKHYQGHDRSVPPTVVLEKVQLLLAPGDGVAVIGPSGCGKSTLLNLLAGLDEPTSGQVSFAGRNLADMEAAQRASFRNREIGLVFQDHHLLPQCTALENVLLPTLVPGAPVQGDDAAKRATDLLAAVGLADKATQLPAQLSGGERQRVALSRALINRPRLLLADEPTGSLDARTADLMADLLGRLKRQHDLTMVVVTHSHNLASRFARMLTLRDHTLQQADEDRP